MLPIPTMSTETWASCAEARQTGAPKMIDANRDRFIMHQISATDPVVEQAACNYMAPTIHRLSSLLTRSCDLRQSVIRLRAARPLSRLPLGSALGHSRRFDGAFDISELPSDMETQRLALHPGDLPVMIEYLFHNQLIQVVVGIELHRD